MEPEICENGVCIQAPLRTQWIKPRGAKEFVLTVSFSLFSSVLSKQVWVGVPHRLNHLFSVCGRRRVHHLRRSQSEEF